MTDKEYIKKELEEKLKRVKEQIQILDMIQYRLLQMRELAQKVSDND